MAFIGSNGAGKSTTIKMMTGIFFPTFGRVDMPGLDPMRYRKRPTYKIGAVFGRRSWILPNLPIIDSLELFGVIYDHGRSRRSSRGGSVRPLSPHLPRRRAPL